MEETKTTIVNENADSIEISKNSKGYTWSIKRYYTFGKDMPVDIILQIAELDKLMQEKFKVEEK